MRIINLSFIFILVISLQAIESSNYLEDIKQGKQYLKQNNINLAIAAFQRVLIYDPNNDTAKFYLGVIFAKQNDINLAKKYFSSIKNPTPTMKKKINDFLKKHSNKKEIYLKTGVLFDSNINNTTDYDTWNIVIDNTSTTVSNSEHQTSAFSIYGILSINYIKPQFLNNFFIYSKKVIDNSDKDIDVFGYNPILITNKNNFTIKHSFNYNYVQYANESYLNRFNFNEGIEKIFNNYKNTLNLSLTSNKYIKDSDYNHYTISISNQLKKYFYNNSTQITLGLENGIEEKNTNKNISYTSFKTAIDYKTIISKKTLDFIVNYDIKRYKDKNIYFQKKQIDNKFDCKLFITTQGSIKYQTKIEYINNDSNIKPYSYDKWIIDLGIIKNFKGL